jgi:hypothetical protein
MRTRGSGFALIELLVLFVIVLALIALVFVLTPRAQLVTDLGGGRCMSNVRGLVALLELVPRGSYPKQDGANLILYLVKRGDLQGVDRLGTLFCPGDMEESLEQAGGPGAYEKLDLSVRTNGHLTSYAGRRMRDPACLVKRKSGTAVVLIADDSEDHHDGKGLVVGLTGGSARFRDKVDDYGLDPSRGVGVGPDSTVEELRCLSAD